MRSPSDALTGTGAAQPREPDGKCESAPCDFCGVARLVWRKCKLMCESCGNINKSCADL